MNVQNCDAIFKAQAPDERVLVIEATSLASTSIPARFTAKLNPTQLSHWEQDRQILITSVPPAEIGSEEVTFVRSGEVFIALYPPTNCRKKLHQYLEEKGGFYILLSERDCYMPEIPEVEAIYAAFGENVDDVPHHDYRRAVCCWAA
jgi:hypothetical protein